MKKKDTEETKTPPFKIGERVLTGIAKWPGEIVRIEEKRTAYSSYLGCTDYKEFTVKIQIPMLDQPHFKDVTMVCLEQELTRLTD